MLLYYFTFPKNLELNLDTIVANNPFSTVVFCDFNFKSKLSCKSYKISHNGSEINDITSQFKLKQLINEPTYITIHSSSCIDLLFQPNLVMESGINSLLHKNWYHQIIYAKFNIKIYYLPPSKQESRIIKKQTENNRKAIDQFPWVMYVTNIVVKKKFNLFNKTRKNNIRL